jgi:hypothetical protein
VYLDTTFSIGLIARVRTNIQPTAAAQANATGFEGATYARKLGTASTTVTDTATAKSDHNARFFIADNNGANSLLVAGARTKRRVACFSEHFSRFKPGEARCRGTLAADVHSICGLGSRKSRNARDDTHHNTDTIVDWRAAELGLFAWMGLLSWWWARHYSDYRYYFSSDGTNLMT